MEEFRIFKKTWNISQISHICIIIHSLNIVLLFPGNQPKTYKLTSVRWATWSLGRTCTSWVDDSKMIYLYGWKTLSFWLHSPLWLHGNRLSVNLWQINTKLNLKAKSEVETSSCLAVVSYINLSISTTGKQEFCRNIYFGVSDFFLCKLCSRHLIKNKWGKFYDC